MSGFIRRHGTLLLRGSSCAAVVVVLLGVQNHQPVRADADARIRYYQAKIGGPATYPAYARLGAAYLQKARETGRSEYYDDAERYLERSIGFQRNFEAARWLAAVYSARHKFQQALLYAREALSAMPSDIESQAALFDAQLGLGDRQAASAILTRMFQQGPGFTADTRLAALRQKEGNLAEAIQAMKRACEAADASVAPAETRAWCQVERGFLYFQSGDRKNAESDYERALEILPGYYHALKHLAELSPGDGHRLQRTGLFPKPKPSHHPVPPSNAANQVAQALSIPDAAWRRILERET
jgi:tetratricopeptide (TPR) repeat protein